MFFDNEEDRNLALMSAFDSVFKEGNEAIEQPTMSILVFNIFAHQTAATPSFFEKRPVTVSASII